MIAEMSTPDTIAVLSESSVRSELVARLDELKQRCGTLERPQVLTILGQWYHPLHYFPTFLARLIAVTPGLSSKTFISRILWQELGEGDPLGAHENVYLSTIADGNFVPEAVAGAPPSEATRELIRGYEEASERYLSGLGFLYGTETVDLPMVSTVGELMAKCTGKDDLAWVNIHVKQEPEHVESSNEALRPAFTASEQRKIINEAEQMWALWIGFFQSIEKEILG
jgi:Iron-containing redox enzyme